MISHRPKDFDKVSSMMLLRLEGHGLEPGQKLALVRLARSAIPDEGVPWGGAVKIIADLLQIINDRRQRDGRPAIDREGLRDAIRAMLKGRRKEPIVEELSDALCNLREARLGVRKVPPLTDGDIKRTA